MKFSLAWIILGVILSVIEDISAQNCPPFSRIKNGRVKYRSRRRIAKFRCRKRYELFGAKSAVCIQDKWSHLTPKCVAARCSDVDDIDNMVIQKSYKGAVLDFICQPGYLLQGVKQIYCDGRQWSDDTPLCHYKPPEMECTFEMDLCGWSDDPNDDFDWSVHQGGTPTARTGPTYDHTLKNEEGQYLYVETSSPRRPGDIARLFSPLYDSMDTGFCFDFYYHMMGPEGKNKVGDLMVFIKDKDVDLRNLQPVFNRSQHQGIEWLRGRIELGQRQSKFQIVITAVRRLSYSSDIAIDDVRIYNCSEDGDEFDQTTMVEVTAMVSTEAELSTASMTSTESVSFPAESSTLIVYDRSTSIPNIIPQENNVTMQTMTVTGAIETSQPETEIPSGMTTERVSEATATQPTKEISTSITSQSPGESSSLVQITVQSRTSVKPETTTNVLSTMELTSNVVLTEQTEMQTTKSSELPTTKSSSTTDFIPTTQGITKVSTEQSTFSTKPQQTTTSTTALKTPTTSLMTSAETRPSTTTAMPTTTSITTPTRSPTTTTRSPTTTTRSPTTTTRSPTTPTSSPTTLLTSPSTTTSPTTISRSPSTSATSATPLSTSTLRILQTTLWRSSPTSSGLPTTVSVKPTTTKITKFVPKDSKSTAKLTTAEPIALSTDIDINTGSSITNKFNSSSQKSMPIVTTSKAISVETIGLNKTENITDIPNVVSVGKSTRPSGPVKPLMIGVGVGVAVGLAIVLVAIFVYLKKKRIKTEEYEDEMAPIAKNAYSEW